jgi:Complex 1 protein (LYR family)
MNGSVVSSGGVSAMQRPVSQLYRDCLRLVRHMAPGMFNATNRKATALRTMVRHEFRKFEHVDDPKEIEACKANAIRALSNYYVLKSLPNDTKVQEAASKYHQRSVQSANDDSKR